MRSPCGGVSAAAASSLWCFSCSQRSQSAAGTSSGRAARPRTRPRRRRADRRSRRRRSAKPDLARGRCSWGLEQLAQGAQALELLRAVEAVAGGRAAGLDQPDALDVAQHPGDQPVVSAASWMVSASCDAHNLTKVVSRFVTAHGPRPWRRGCCGGCLWVLLVEADHRADRGVGDSPTRQDDLGRLHLVVAVPGRRDADLGAGGGGALALDDVGLLGLALGLADAGGGVAGQLGLGSALLGAPCALGALAVRRLALGVDRAAVGAAGGPGSGRRGAAAGSSTAVAVAAAAAPRPEARGARRGRRAGRAGPAARSGRAPRRRGWRGPATPSASSPAASARRSSAS